MKKGRQCHTEGSKRADVILRETQVNGKITKRHQNKRDLKTVKEVVHCRSDGIRTKNPQRKQKQSMRAE